jgi:hypothetical protein
LDISEQSHYGESFQRLLADWEALGNGVFSTQEAWALQHHGQMLPIFNDEGHLITILYLSSKNIILLVDKFYETEWLIESLR